MKSTEKTPVRKCISCGSKKSKEKFIMIVRSPKKECNESFSLLDGAEKKEGRGAYICKKSECLKNVIKFHRLEKVFKRKISSEIYDTREEIRSAYE